MKLRAPHLPCHTCKTATRHAGQSYCKECIKASRKPYIKKRKPKKVKEKVVIMRDFVSERREKEIAENHNPVLSDFLRRRIS